MNSNTFSTQTGKAYYYNSVAGFLKDKPAVIIERLTDKAFDVTKEQVFAWKNQINELQSRIRACNMDGNIIFEYDIVRMGKRIDVILLIRHMVFSLEFKNGKKIYEVEDEQQAEDYALDIKNFHKESEDLYVCPILIATDAKPYANEQSIGCYPDKQVYLQRENINTLIPKITTISGTYGNDTPLDFNRWFNSPYYPTPTIIAAAVEAYKSHNVSAIARSEAGQDNINKCEAEIYDVISYAEHSKKKCICFVTGVPGAGKTLVGLDVVAKGLEQGNRSVYLSGNGPLVEVLRAALVKSAKVTNTYGERKTSPAVKAMIQRSYDFKRDNASPSTYPLEHILVFDEAQRIWDEAQMTKSHENDPAYAVSEAHFMYRVMDRHQDWAVIICLVGLGQDIYDGEIGINEWFRSGINDFSEWELFYSPDIFDQTEDKGIDRGMIDKCPRCHKRPGLHLKTSIRSFRAEKQCQFVDLLLDNNPRKAAEIYGMISEKYPIYITRDIDQAKDWVHKQVRGSQRCGVLASSSAQRLKPYGVYVAKDIDVPNWFLAPSYDIRSSNMLEIAASEFKVQGLEIDWALVCWDADLRRNVKADAWDHYSFRGSKWNRRHKLEQQRYLLNSYRVLLTRARQGMIIFVPKGVDPERDPTRDHAYYDGIYNYLVSCGIKELD